MMDHVIAIRRKVEELRAEIAGIRILNEQQRREKDRDPSAQMAHLERLSRLEEIKEELARLAALGRPAPSSSEPGGNERPIRPFLVKRAS